MSSNESWVFKHINAGYFCHLKVCIYCQVVPSSANYNLAQKQYKSEKGLTLVLICFGSRRNWVQHTVDKADNNAPGRAAGYYLVFTEGKGSADFERKRKHSTTLRKHTGLWRYLSRSTTTVTLLGISSSGIGLEPPNTLCPNSFKFPSYIRIDALCKEVLEAPFVLLI